MQYLEFQCLYVSFSKYLLCRRFSTPPLTERNYFTTHHFTSFRSRKAICFQHEEYPPLPISIIFLVRTEPGFPALPDIRTRNFNPARNAKPDNGTPRRTCMSGRLSGTRFVLSVATKWKK
ncbi:hypothetical protein CEXT_243311 [Caerostris extrusa]|uniref:Uncharacterized protein n=1 Tax=Caerostris extrusa TaxID=172846 RepID=A0AAV4XRS0_CAEEX|nr:hypothetical protein CEXT_243311 [Caerostris extrusa]